jgi:EAL domain-containing protein (putative c-di-GMP-specific phosphodiesterase class I)/CBS domain-containing protein
MISLKGFFNLLKQANYIERRNKLIERIKLELQNSLYLSLFYIEIINRLELEMRFGELACIQVIQALEKILPKFCYEVFQGATKLVAIDKPWVDNYAIYISTENIVDYEQLNRISNRLKELLEYWLDNNAEESIQCLKFQLGYSPVKRTNGSTDIYKSIELAIQMARKSPFSDEFKHTKEFYEILDNEVIHMRFQPIVSLRTGQCFGWEALARGPENSFFHTPANLFPYAEKLEQSHCLERICHRKALAKLRGLEPKNKLFLNLDPRSLDDTYLLSGIATPNQVVLEITEHHAITNYNSFQRTINKYRKKGYLIAVDDAGAGYSSLEAITTILPDFIKMDMSLIRNIDIDPVKQALLETFVNFAAKVKCKIIAEGIETESELEKLIALGVDYGQGFFLGKPEKELLNMTSKVRMILEEQICQKKLSSQLQSEGNARVLDIATKTLTVGVDEKVKAVYERFENYKKIECIVIVEKNKKPVGLIMRSQFYNALGSQFGMPLYFEKSISNLMNFSPLIVEADDLVEDAAKRAMDRETSSLYDTVIVTDNEKYVGIVSFQALLESLLKSKHDATELSDKISSLTRIG